MSGKQVDLTSHHRTAHPGEMIELLDGGLLGLAVKCLLLRGTSWLSCTGSLSRDLPIMSYPRGIMTMVSESGSQQQNRVAAC